MSKRLNKPPEKVIETSQDVLSDHTRKLRHTFAEIVPVLRVRRGAVAFYCKEQQKVIVYSIIDGDIVSETVGSSYLVETALNLEHEGIPINKVDEKQLKKISMAFKHISEIEGNNKKYEHKDPLSGLRQELEELKVELSNRLN